MILVSGLIRTVISEAALVDLQPCGGLSAHFSAGFTCARRDSFSGRWEKRDPENGCGPNSYLSGGVEKLYGRLAAGRGYRVLARLASARRLSAPSCTFTPR
jgi:hypothetical protein